MKKLFKNILKYIFYFIFRPIWWCEKLIPRNRKIWVFGAWYGLKYSDNSKWFYEYITKNKENIKAVWITRNKTILKLLRTQNKKVYMSNSILGVYYCLRAKYVLLTNTQDDVNKFCINGSKQIWLWHGMPLKKIVYCDDVFINTPKWKVLLRKILFPYSTVRPYCTLTSADFFTPFLMDSFHLASDKIWKTGLPRCDSFFSNKIDTFIKKIREEYPSDKFLLYMPTFRMSSNMDGESFSSFVKQYNFNEEEFAKFLEQQKIVFLFKPHFVDSEISINIPTKRFKFIKDDEFDDLYILLNSIDVLLTDYSSVYFDFLASKKTIFLLPFDYEQYVKKSRAHFFNMFEEMNGIICKDWKDFYKQYIINSSIKKSSISEDFRKFANYLNGNSCELLYKKILDD